MKTPRDYNPFIFIFASAQLTFEAIKQENEARRARIAHRARDSTRGRRTVERGWARTQWGEHAPRVRVSRVLLWMTYLR